MEVEVLLLFLFLFQNTKASLKRKSNQHMKVIKTNDHAKATECMKGDRFHPKFSKHLPEASSLPGRGSFFCFPLPALRCTALYMAMLSCQTLDWCLENLGLGQMDVFTNIMLRMWSTHPNPVIKHHVGAQVVTWCTPPKFNIAPAKMVGLEDKPFLLGFGNFLGGELLKLGRVQEKLKRQIEELQFERIVTPK